MPQLNHESCRLLQAEELVDRFNAVDQVLEEATQKLPRFAEREVIAKVRANLGELAEAMTKKRFSIGFIGPSQAGKSTTVGNLLSVSKDECPAPEGSGGPTTSVPTRLVPVAEPDSRCKGGERHLIELQYMTKCSSGTAFATSAGSASSTTTTTCGPCSKPPGSRRPSSRISRHRITAC